MNKTRIIILTFKKQKNLLCYFGLFTKDFVHKKVVFSAFFFNNKEFL